MAEKFARKRVAQICKDDSNYKPTTVVHIEHLFFVLLSTNVLRRGFWHSSKLNGFVLPNQRLRTQ